MVACERKRRVGGSRLVRRRYPDHDLGSVLGYYAFLGLPHYRGQRPSYVANWWRVHGTEGQQHRVRHDRIRGHVVQQGRIYMASSESLTARETTYSKNNTYNRHMMGSRLAAAVYLLP